MTSRPEDVSAEDEASPAETVPDERLLAAHDLALSALREITPADTIGAPAGYTVEADGVVSLRFATTQAGYPGWFWTVSLAVVEDAEPTVLEAELLPGEGALLAPEWVPWAVRLAEYQAQQAVLAAAGEASDDAEDDAELEAELEAELDDIDDLDAEDFDRDGSRILHAGDVDGVDIDELADDDADESDDDDSDDDADSGDDEDAADGDSDEDADESDDAEDEADGSASDDDEHDDSDPDAED
ncbi:MAG: DUF3027 domain-containing protein [Microbacterium sp.]|uniref:DUF3027 domain-containing protein n=1 Tax=Microbacterium sp. TaxID=51671 RepID=UPI001ACD1ACA|nr:DUF3027 domain-containing protein [Microbacterium sp.]MBN9188942.1 DUF3027 domain-containing protein [Microbacterium sp.]MBN9194327.1 DUF3027 domain-containing protein [Microbacterium sp.]MBN9196934.1 DUF3027 domain-containing protein [Microbacterium sp.]